MSILSRSVASVLSRVMAPKIIIGPKTMSNRMNMNSMPNKAPPANKIFVNGIDRAKSLMKVAPREGIFLRELKRSFKPLYLEILESSLAFASQKSDTSMQVNNGSNIILVSIARASGLC